MGELREYFTTTLPKFDDPAIFISSEFIPGCPRCNSSASVYQLFVKKKKDFNY